MKGDFAAAATEVDGYFGTRRAGKAYHHFDQEACFGPGFGPAIHEPFFLMGDSPNRTLHVVSTLLPPAQKAIDFFVFAAVAVASDTDDDC